MVNEKNIIELANGDGIIRYFNKLSLDYSFPEDTRKILQEIGIPKYVAPFIEFFDELNGGGKRLSDYYNLNLYQDSENVEKEELEKIKIYFKEYIVLGNIENDVFVLNEKFRVIQINYETLDEYYVNYSLNKFLESLLVYKKIVDIVRSRGEESAFFDDEVTENDIKLLKENLLEIDKYSFIDDSFWSNEIERLEENI
ncbi:SUKH-4 family immunity protein [Clostridium saccharoperbutylacetonicum]